MRIEIGKLGTDSYRVASLAGVMTNQGCNLSLGSVARQSHCSFGFTLVGVITNQGGDTSGTVITPTI